jgi:hypothetical protein
MLLSACGSADNKETITDSLDTNATVRTDSMVPDTTTIPQQATVMNDTLFKVSFTDSNQQEIKAHLKKDGPSIICHFTLVKPSSLVATIIPGKADCNIRINNIILPGNKTDGPFGREMKYSLPKKGEYKLVIGHNLMASGAESCDFVLKMKLN